MYYTTITSFAIVAFAALTSAAPVGNNTNSNLLGCSTNADCANRGPGWTCSHNICVGPAPASSAAPSSSAIPLGCSTNADCAGRYPYPAICQHAICVPAPVSSAPVSSAPVSSAPVSSAPASSAPPALGCMSDKDCQSRYPGQNAYCGPHNICMFGPASSSIPISSSRPASSSRPQSSAPISSSRPQPPASSSRPHSSAPASSSPPALGCMTDADCNGRYPYPAICVHNMCVKFNDITTVGPPVSSTKSAPHSSVTPPPPVGCMTDADCNGRYPYPAICVHNMCVKFNDITTVTPPTTVTTTTTSIHPIPPPPPPMGCNCDQDCAGRYPWEAVCEHNICVPKKPFVPTSTITTYPPPPPTTTHTGTVTITVYPPPPPYHPTTVTVYECVTTTTSSSSTTTKSTPSAEATLFPNLIVPIKQAEPNGAFGTQYTGAVSSTTPNNNVDSLFAFDIPFIYETQNPTCQLTFTFPAPNTGFPRTVTGTGQVDLYALQSSNGMETATWNTRPTRGAYLGRIQVVDGQIASWIAEAGAVPCVGGSRVGVEMVPVGQTSLEWFEMKTPLTGLTLEVFA